MGLTAQRREILNTLNTSCEHLTAEQILHLTRERVKNLALGTVYRNLNLLVQEDLVRRIPVLGGPDRFDRNPRPHDHIVCLRCGLVCDTVCTANNDIAAASAAQSGWTVTGYDLLLHGICPGCGRCASGQ